jgi:hypothetical protein
MMKTTKLVASIAIAPVISLFATGPLAASMQAHAFPGRFFGGFHGGFGFFHRCFGFPGFFPGWGWGFPLFYDSYLC